MQFEQKAPLNFLVLVQPVYAEYVSADRNNELNGNNNQVGGPFNRVVNLWLKLWIEMSHFTFHWIG